MSIYRAQHKHKLSQIRSIIYSVKINIACRCWMWWDKDRMNEKSETKNNTIQIELEKWRNWTINLNFVLFKSLSCHTLHRRAIDRQQSKSTRLCRRQQQNERKKEMRTGERVCVAQASSSMSEIDRARDSKIIMVEMSTRDQYKGSQWK